MAFIKWNPLGSPAGTAAAFLGRDNRKISTTRSNKQAARFASARIALAARGWIAPSVRPKFKQKANFGGFHVIITERNQYLAVFPDGEEIENKANNGWGKFISYCKKIAKQKENK